MTQRKPRDQLVRQESREPVEYERITLTLTKSSLRQARQLSEAWRVSLDSVLDIALSRLLSDALRSGP